MEIEVAKREANVVLDGLRRIVRGLRASSHAARRELAVTGAQLDVLGEIAAEPNTSIQRLSERTLTDPSSVSVVVARLVEKRLVTRARDPRDARRSVLSVTRQGASLVLKAPRPYPARLFAVLRRMPTSELRRLGALLSTVVSQLERSSGAAPLFFEESPRRGTRGRR